MVINMWALIINGAVREVTDIDPKGRFHQSLKWVKCDGEVRQQMLYEDGKFIAPPVDEVEE